MLDDVQRVLRQRGDFVGVGEVVGRRRLLSTVRRPEEVDGMVQRRRQERVDAQELGRGGRHLHQDHVHHVRPCEKRSGN